MEIRHFGKTKDIIPVPSLVNLQSKSYDEFLDSEIAADKRDPAKGLEAILREFFPITGYDDQVQVSYHGYVFSPPQHTIDECRDLGLTFQRGLKVKIRVSGANIPEVLEEDVHIGYFPIRIGGGEFVINGAERTIVTQIQRSPGVDFSSETSPNGRRVFSCRIIPERGSWIQVEMTSKDILQIKIDKSAKVVATCFLRALSPDFGTTEQIISHFFTVEEYAVQTRGVKEKVVGKILARDVLVKDNDEPLGKACEVLTESQFENFKGLGVEKIAVITDAVKPDDIFLNTLREDEATTHKEALLRIYRRLRPGNPTDEVKVQEFFTDRFLNEQRYNLG